VLVRYPEIARYYAAIFESDWSTALRKVPQVGGAAVTPEKLAKGGFVEVAAADYQEV
jgi:hypothetical protein